MLSNLGLLLYIDLLNLVLAYISIRKLKGLMSSSFLCIHIFFTKKALKQITVSQKFVILDKCYLSVTIC